MSADEHEFTIPPIKKKRNIKSTKIDDKEEEAYQFMKKANEELSKKDEFTTYGQLVAHKIRNLNAINRLLAQQRINNILFDLEMQQITGAGATQNDTEMRNVTEIQNMTEIQVTDEMLNNTEMSINSSAETQLIDITNISEFVTFNKSKYLPK